MCECRYLNSYTRTNAEEIQVNGSFTPDRKYDKKQWKLNCTLYKIHSTKENHIRDERKRKLVNKQTEQNQTNKQSRIKQTLNRVKENWEGKRKADA